MSFDAIFEALESFVIRIYEIIANVFKMFETPDEAGEEATE